MAAKYSKLKFFKYKPKKRQNINFRQELEKLVKDEMDNSLKDLFQNGDLFKKTKDGPFVFNGGADKEKNRKQKVFDEKQMEFDIDRAVAETLMRGKHTTGVLKALFGLVPSLIGR